MTWQGLNHVQLKGTTIKSEENNMSIDSEIKKHRHILVCGDNVNSLNIVRSLGERDIAPTVILFKDDSVLSLLSKSRYCGEIVTVHSYDEAINALMNYVDEGRPPFVYLTDDGHLQFLDEHYEMLKGKFYLFNGGEKGRLTYYLNKEKQCMLAKECGFSVPGFEEVERGELPSSVSYPVITKTWNSYSDGWKKDVTICYSATELLQSYPKMTSKRLLLQEYVEKSGELSMQGLSIDGGKEVFMPFERMYLRFSETSFGGYMYYQPFSDEILKRNIQTMLKTINYSGCFEIEFIVDKQNRLHFLEVNLRFSASNYGLNTGGVNLPYLWAKSVLTGSIDSNDLYIRKERYYVVNDMIDWQYAKNVGYLRWLKQLLTADGYYLYNSRDLRPFVLWWMQKIRRAFCRKQR